MEQYLVAFVFFIAAFLFMGFSLHFSKYKKRGAGCGCHGSSGHRRDSVNGPSCATCPTKTDTSTATP